MADIQIISPSCTDDREGDRGHRGHRGPRGHDGHDGDDGDDGETGPTGSTGSAGATGPTGFTGSTGATFPPIIGAANINSNGDFIDQFGFSTSTNPVTGQYVLTLTTPPPPIPGVDGLVVLISLAGFVGGQFSHLFDSLGVIRVFTFDNVGAPAAKIFSIAVFSLA